VFLGAVAAWLAIVWLLSRPDPDPLPAGLVFAAILAAGAFVFALGGGLGLDTAVRRALRAAGAAGLREVSRRALARVRRIPSAVEASAVLDAIASERRLADAARSLAALVGDAPLRPKPLVDAVLRWVRRESNAFRASPPERPPRLRTRAGDWALLASALTPFLAIALG